MLKIENLGIKYGDTKIVDNMSFEVEVGDFVILSGSNGSGKTSLLKCILYQNKTFDGKISIDGESVATKKKWTDIGYLSQKININHDIPITVLEYLNVYSTDPEKLKSLIADFELEELLKKKINGLSGGQFQRINIAKTLSQDIKYLFLDEPDSSLDVDKREMLYEKLGEINKAGTTILMISHNISEIKNDCKIYNMKTKEFERR